MIPCCGRLSLKVQINANCAITDLRGPHPAAGEEGKKRWKRTACQGVTTIARPNYKVQCVFWDPSLQVHEKGNGKDNGDCCQASAGLMCADK